MEWLSDSDVDEPCQAANDEVSGTETSSDVQLSGDDTFDNASEDEDTDDDNEWRRLTDDDGGAMPVHFTATPGPKNIPENINKPIDYFNLFFDDAFIDKIVEETNRYSDQYFEENQQFLAGKPRSRYH